MSSDTNTDALQHPDDCAGCEIARALERRDFLRRVVATGVAALAGAAIPARADALRISFGDGEGTGPEKAYAIPAGDGAVIDRRESVIIARFDQRAYAFSLACPHQNTAIRWEDRNNRFQCPKHKSRYRPDGTFIEGRATRGLDRFAVRREADRLMVNLDFLYREDENAAEWARAFVSLDAAAQ